MPISLQSALSQLSDEFAQKVFGLVRTALVTELNNVTLSMGSPAASRTRAEAPKTTTSTVATSSKAPAKVAAQRGRLERRSSASIAQALDGIVALLRKKPGLGSEEIQKTLGLARNEVARPITLGLSTGALRKAGEKRATKYSAVTVPSAAKSVDAAPKKAARKATSAKKTASVKKVVAKKKIIRAKKAATKAMVETPVPPLAT